MLRSRSNTLKTNKSGVDMIFVLTVFVLFVCCLLAAVLTSLCASLQAQQQRLAEKLIRLHVLAFAKAYKHFGSEIEKRFDTATAQTLVLQKLRSYDSGAISVGKQGDTDYLGFSDTIDGESYITYIYCYDGELRELFVESSAPFVAENGNTLFPADKFTASADQNTISFTITCDGVQTSSHYCLRSGKEGAG